MKPPHNVAFLERAIRKSVDTDENGVRLRTMMANSPVQEPEPRSWASPKGPQQRTQQRIVCLM